MEQVIYFKLVNEINVLMLQVYCTNVNFITLFGENWGMIPWAD